MPRWSRDPRDKHKVGRGTLRKHAASKVWYFQYKDEHGRWKSRSTGHRDKIGATEWATAFSLELTRREKGIITPDAQITDDGILAAADEWLKYVGSQCKPKTLRGYRSVRNNLERFLSSRSRVSRLSHFDKEQSLAFREWLRNNPSRKTKRTKKTCDNNLTVVRVFFNWCIAMKKVGNNPVREERHGMQVFFKERKARIETYTVSEYQAIIRGAPKDLERICEILALTGMRISELAMLEWSDADFGGGWLHIRIKTTHDGVAYSPKDSTDRKLPISRDLEAILRRLREERGGSGYVVPGSYGASRADNFSRATLKKLKRLAKKVGISRKKLTLHNFRRYFISQCADCGIDMACVMEWVGHDELRMVMYYYRLRDDHAKAAMQKFTTGPMRKPNAAQRGPRQNSGEHLGKSTRPDSLRATQATSGKALTTRKG